MVFLSLLLAVYKLPGFLEQSFILSRTVPGKKLFDEVGGRKNVGGNLSA